MLKYLLCIGLLCQQKFYEWTADYTTETDSFSLEGSAQPWPAQQLLVKKEEDIR